MSGLAPIGKKAAKRGAASNDDYFSNMLDSILDAPTSGNKVEDSFDSSFNSTSLASETSFPSPSPTKNKIRGRSPPTSYSQAAGGSGSGNANTNKSFLNDSVDLESSSGDPLDEVSS